MYGIIDCDNCYVSCERVFRPDLKDTPIVVLSNNDGCVVARSNEAKKLGIKAGVPYYQLEELFPDNKIAVFDENGCEGYFLAPTRNVHQLNFDQESGCLMISMTDGIGKVEAYSPNATSALLQTSRELRLQLKKGNNSGVTTGLLENSGTDQE